MQKHVGKSYRFLESDVLGDEKLPEPKAVPMQAPKGNREIPVGRAIPHMRSHSWGALGLTDGIDWAALLIYLLVGAVVWHSRWINLVEPIDQRDSSLSENHLGGRISMRKSGIQKKPIQLIASQFFGDWPCIATAGLPPKVHPQMHSGGGHPRYHGSDKHVVDRDTNERYRNLV